MVCLDFGARVDRPVDAVATDRARGVGVEDGLDSAQSSSFEAKA